MKKLIRALLPILDLIIAPFVIPSAIVMKIIRRLGIKFLPITKKILLSIGVFPIRDHYYEPLFNPKHLRYSLKKEIFLVLTLTVLNKWRY